MLAINKKRAFLVCFFINNPHLRATVVEAVKDGNTMTSAIENVIDYADETAYYDR